MTNLKSIFKTYTAKELLDAYLGWILFLSLYLAIFLIPTITIMYLYPPYIKYVLYAIFIIIIIISFYTNNIFVRILKGYQTLQSNNYLSVMLFNSLIVAFVTFIIELIVYLSIY